MAERKAVNKYIPADFDPNKHGSVNKYRQSHPLRERARKLDQGILVIRFELPYNIWCNGCNNHVGMGVRYNAEKSKTGMYYSTPIYKFRMKCHLCDNHFEMETDPANLDYKILNGARRQENRWDPKDNEQILTEDKDDIKKMATDAMFRLEHDTVDINKAVSLKPALEKLQDLQGRWKDDFTLNQLMRGTFRIKKRQIFEQNKKDEELLKKSCLAINLLPESSDDAKLAPIMRQESRETFEEKRTTTRLKLINEPLFPIQSSSKNDQLRDIKECLIVKKLEEDRPSLDRESLGIVIHEPKSSMPMKSLVPYQNDSDTD